MKAPFPWFGGKSQIAAEVWRRFGDTPNYVEPFFGSGAILLARPGVRADQRRTETVNDKDGWLTNVWRSIQRDHVQRMEADPDYYDPQMAGVWLWGVCSTIGNAWKPRSTNLGPGDGIHRACTNLGSGREDGLIAYFSALSRRLERVRVMSGDWTRVTSPSVTRRHGLTAMFLDPPYIDDCCAVYEHNDDCRAAVREYAIEHGSTIRIALCCYAGEQDMPSDWSLYRWKAGGYGSQGRGRGRANAQREQVWFSPACIAPGLFDRLDPARAEE